MRTPGSGRSGAAPADYASRFPGCRPVRLLTDRLTDFESRLEYPDDTPLLRSLGDRARSEGHAAGRAEELAVLVRSALRTRGIPVSDRFPGASVALADVPRDVLMAAALACVDEQDFRRRVGSPD